MLVFVLFVSLGLEFDYLTPVARAVENACRLRRPSIVHPCSCLSLLKPVLTPTYGSSLIPALRRWRIAHLGRGPIPTDRPRRRRADAISRRRSIIPVTIHRTIIALPRRASMVSSRVAAPAMFAVVMSGVRGTAVSTTAAVIMTVVAVMARARVRGP